ncbi:hypothetical protein LWI29_008461 [Acer saccharum]|uniref:At1g61320/AtMIF1 LRR domain-containing protein n=1 Tax=Acer saccharum TaxID=4024 RepID=A0AA39VMN9_ACESA|nr:hypothetical protein LWI29_008461 [Acer saccharum]
MGNDLAFNNLDPTSAYDRKPIKRFLKLVPKFINFVDASLSRFSDLNLCMQKFKLMICVIVDIQRMSSVLEKWIRSAVECGVKELDFHAKTDTEVAAVIYTLPQILFSAESMNTIKLRGCKLELPSKNIIRLHSLKSLTLKEVCIQEETIQKLTGGQCPLLEDLSLRECWGFKRIYITEAHKLKTIKIRAPVELGTISIHAPSLQLFKLGYSGLQGPIAIDMVGCPNLAVLKLSCVTFTHQEFHRLISNFPLLEFLDLNVCDILERISISSNTLM